MILEREPIPTTLIMEKISRCKVSISKEQRWALHAIKVETQKNSKYSQVQSSPTNLEARCLLIAKGGDKREPVLVKRTLKGQNVSTHLTSNLPQLISSNKSCGGES